MDTLKLIVTIAQMLLAVGVIAIVMMQEGNERGLGAISGGSDSFFSRNESATPQAKLRRATTWLGILFVLLTVGLGIVVNLVA